MPRVAAIPSVSNPCNSNPATWRSRRVSRSPPHTGDSLLHSPLEISAIWLNRAQGQQRLALPPLLTTERMYQREQLLKPCQLVTAESTALVESSKKQHQRQSVPHRQDHPHLLLPAGGLIEVVAIFGIEPPLGDLRQGPDAGRQALLQRLHKGILTEVAGEVAIKQQGPLMIEVVVEIDGPLPNPEQQGAIKRHLLLDQPHQRRRKSAAVQGIDHLGHTAGHGICGERLDHGRWFMAISSG